MTVLGIDVSTLAVDLVYLDDDTDAATWQRIQLPKRKPAPRGEKKPAHETAEESTAAIRIIRATFPRRHALETAGVWLVAIEDPIGEFAHSAKWLGEITGAVKALIPPELETVSLTPQAWRKANGIPPTGEKARVVTPHARRLLELVQATDGWPPDAFDAWLIARAARHHKADPARKENAA